MNAPSPTPRPAPRRPIAGMDRLVFSVLLALLALLAALLAMTIDRAGDSYAATANALSLAMFLMASYWLWSTLTRLARRVSTADLRRRAGTHIEPPPTSASDLFLQWTQRRMRRPERFILAVAAAARLVVMLTHAPQLSDDLWRYMHDGRTLASGHNPFAAAPAELVMHEDDDPLISRINNNRLVTIYLPTSQWVFAAAWTLHVPALDPLGDRTMRLVLVGFDLAAIAVLLAALARRGLSPWWATLYAWHPLAISETAGSGHQDVIGIFFMLVALAMATDGGERPPAASTISDPSPTSDRSGATWRAIIVGVALALGGAVKPHVLALALPIAWHMRHQRRALLAMPAALLISSVLLYAPFLCMPGGMDRLADTLHTFTHKWAFNSAIFMPVQWTFDALALRAAPEHGWWSALGYEAVRRRIVGGLFAALLLGVLLMSTRRGPWRAAQAYLLAAVLLTPTAHPWYVLWPLALLPLAFSPAAWLLSLTIGWSYVWVLSLPHIVVPPWVVIAQFAPVLALVLSPLALRWLAQRRAWPAPRWWRQIERGGNGPPRVKVEPTTSRGSA